MTLPIETGTVAAGTLTFKNTPEGAGPSLRPLPPAFPALGTIAMTPATHSAHPASRRTTPEELHASVPLSWREYARPKRADDSGAMFPGVRATTDARLMVSETSLDEARSKGCSSVGALAQR